MNVSSDVFDLLKRIVAWAGVIFLFYIMPFSFHIKLDAHDGGSIVEFTIGKSENSIKIGNEY